MDCSNPCAWMEAARVYMPVPAPVRRTLAGQRISLARLMSVVVVVMVLVVITLSLSLSGSSASLLPGAARAVGMDGEKRLRRDPAARSRSAAQAEEAGWKPLWGREGATPLGPPLCRVRGDGRVRDGSRRPRRRPTGGSGRSPRARPGGRRSG